MLVALCGALLARGMPQHVVSLTGDGPNAAALERLGVTVHRLAPRGAAGSALAVLRLARLIRTLRPAVIQGWLYHGDLFAAGAHRLAGAPRGTLLAWGLRNSDIDHARYGRLLAIGRRLSGWPGLVVSNSQAGADFHRAEGYRPRFGLVHVDYETQERIVKDSGRWYGDFLAGARVEVGNPQTVARTL